MYTIELLPAAHGDAIWIEYGDPQRPHRVVIDGGPAPAYDLGLRKRLSLVSRGQCDIDLFVVTHIDTDHIDGAIILLQEYAALGARLHEVWFNGWKQLAPTTGADLQPLQGEFLSALLTKTPQLRTVWNPRTQNGAIVVAESGPLPAWSLPGGAQVTLLSPAPAQIKRLRGRWDSAIRDFNPGDTEEALRRLKARREYRPPEEPPVFGERTFGDDRSPANGSSIAFILEHEGVSCLFAGDAHPRVLAASLRRMPGAGRSAPVRLNAVKLSHHGSLSNVSEELLETVDCRRWLVSTNGAVYGHPDRKTAVLIAEHSVEPPQFLCNYRCATTLRFADDRPSPRWLTAYPGEGAEEGPAGGLAIELSGAVGRARPRSAKVHRPASARARKGRRP